MSEEGIGVRSGLDPRALDGHVFVVRAELRELACDAVLVTSDEAGAPPVDWRDRLADAAGSPADDPRPVPRRLGAAAGPQVWLTGTRAMAGGPVSTAVPDDAIGCLVERAERFVARAADAVGRTERSRPLVALPVVGTRDGGLRTRAGAVVSAMMERLVPTANELGVDIVVVAPDGEIEALCRHWRRKVWQATHGDEGDHRQEILRRWRRGALRGGRIVEVTASEHLEGLLTRAARGELVPFFGSGVSRSAGSPSWTGLLDEMSPAGARELFADLGEQDAAQMADPFARAQVIANLDDGGGAELRERLERRLAVEHLSLLHVLLANVGARDAITTNYDLGYERACLAAGIVVEVVPRPGGTHRLVKLHGSFGESGGQPLLTRDQLLDFQTERGALAGVLQMLLLTGHLLFVGYSMSDPSLHAAIHAVRRAIEQEAGGGRPTMATSLQVDPSPALAALWHRTVDVAWPDPDRFRSGAERARQKEILLDLFADAASHASVPLLAMGDAAARLDLTDDERRLREALRRLEEATAQRTERTELWAPVEALLERFGRGGITSGNL